MFLGAQQYNENKNVDITWCVQIYEDTIDPITIMKLITKILPLKKSCKETNLNDVRRKVSFT